MLHIDDPDIFIFDLDISIHKTINLWYRSLVSSAVDAHTSGGGFYYHDPSLELRTFRCCCVVSLDVIVFCLCC
jgi:hypothetical protein